MIAYIMAFKGIISAVLLTGAIATAGWFYYQKKAKEKDYTDKVKSEQELFTECINKAKVRSEYEFCYLKVGK